MPERERVIEIPRAGGIRQPPGTSATPTLCQGKLQICRDVTGPGDCHPLYIHKRECSGGLINGKTSSSAPQFTDYVADALRGGDPWFFEHLDFETPSNGAYATKAAARTNPSRPYVDVFTLIAEARDFPDLLRREGGTFLRKLAGYNLKYQFGIAPLVSDLLKLLDFQTQVDNRVKELERLRTRGLRRTVYVDREARSATTNSLIHGGFPRVTVNKHTSLIVRGHCRYSTDGAPNMSAADLRSQARKAVLGLTVDFSTAWELIPFSWLVDWYSNIGEYIAAKRNVVGQRLDLCAIMRETNTIIRADSFTHSSGRASSTPYECRTTTKSRAIASPSLSASLPFLTTRQTGILASIGVKKRLFGRL